VGFGMIADIDIESERLRHLGELRFKLWALHRINKLQSYKVKLSYLKVSIRFAGHKMCVQQCV
jgi:sphingosine kinase